MKGLRSETIAQASREQWPAKAQTLMRQPLTSPLTVELRKRHINTQKSCKALATARLDAARQENAIHNPSTVWLP